MTSSLAASQQAFAAALLDRRSPVPGGLTSWTGSAPQRRFNVYRGNVSSALIEALAVRYPVVRRLVGEDFFRAMTREFALSHLPRSPVLIGYGGDYPEFIARFEPASGLPYLADVARLESAHWQAYHAADAESLGPEAFAGIAPDRLPAARFVFLPSLHLLASPFPIVSIWETNTHDETVSAVDLDVAEQALVCRPDLDVEVRRAAKDTFAFLSALRAGASLGEAVSAVLEAHPHFNLAAQLAGLIRSRIVVGIE